MENESSYFEEDWDAMIEPLLYTDMERYVIYCILPIIVIVGIVGNLSTVIILTTNANMRNSLNIYLTNLAIADSLFLVVAPVFSWVAISQTPLHVFYDNGGYSAEYCKFNTLIVDSTYMVSATLILAISVERFLAITKPLKYRSYVSKKRTVKICVAIWILSFAYQIRNVVTGGTYEYSYPWPDMWNGVPNTSSSCILCSYDFSDETCKILYYFNEAEYVLYLTFLTLMIPLYGMIGCSLFKPCSKKTEIAAAANRTNFERKALTTATITVVIYVILTAPINCIYMYAFRGGTNWDLISKFSSVFRYLAFVNSSINPIIYNISNETYRKAFLKLYGFSSGTAPQKANVQNPSRKYVSTISTKC
ncbi:neuropeptides capa receptor-like [Antedon mediterranea]|uniref:neuropeptides capa receptor-like n=1 Tax=Antedon mediterranea TaxID=105859 RepID=UPI003AF5AB48